MSTDSFPSASGQTVFLCRISPPRQQSDHDGRARHPIHLVPFQINRPRQRLLEPASAGHCHLRHKQQPLSAHEFPVLAVGAGMIMPFGKYDQGSKMLSKWNTNEQHMRIDMRMPYIQLSYNIQWGRQKRETEKLVNTDASADQSSAGGR